MGTLKDWMKTGDPGATGKVLELELVTELAAVKRRGLIRNSLRICSSFEANLMLAKKMGR